MGPTAALVSVGDELLLGETVDTNAAWLGRRLASRGIRVVWGSRVPDVDHQIQAAVRAAMQRADLVVVSGGLGPTPDDLTRASVAALLGLPLKVDERLAASTPPVHPSQTLVPEGARVLPNDHGTAPGLAMDVPEALVVLLPGVPRELRGIVEGEMQRALDRRFGDLLPRVHQRLIHTTGIAESDLAGRLAEVLGDLEDVSLAYLPDRLGVDLRLTTRDLSEESAHAEFDRIEAAMDPILEPFRFEAPDGDIARALLGVLGAAGMTVATAESCTGGLIGQRLTVPAGASAVYLGGVVAYANEVKTTLLGVDSRDLERHGAVSSEVAGLMSEGVVRALGADAGIAVTGVAGPGGGTVEKPVGTVWVAATLRGRTTTEGHTFSGDREAVRAQSAQAALFLLLRRLDGRLG